MTEKYYLSENQVVFSTSTKYATAPDPIIYTVHRTHAYDDTYLYVVRALRYAFKQNNPSVHRYIIKLTLGAKSHNIPQIAGVLTPDELCLFANPATHMMIRPHVHGYEDRYIRDYQDEASYTIRLLHNNATVANIGFTITQLPRNTKYNDKTLIYRDAKVHVRNCSMLLGDAFAANTRDTRDRIAYLIRSKLVPPTLISSAMTQHILVLSSSHDYAGG